MLTSTLTKHCVASQSTLAADGERRLKLSTFVSSRTFRERNRPGKCVLKPVFSRRSKESIRCSASTSESSESEAATVKLNLLQRFTKFVLDPNARTTLPVTVESDTNTQPISTIIYSFLGAFVAFMCLGTLNIYLKDVFSLPFMIGSFGTVSILLFGNPEAPVLNPWNIVMGHMLGAASVMFWIYMPFGINAVVLRALSMGTLVAAMLKFGAVHPPGGAMVIACVDSAQMQALGWWYLLFPGLLGMCILYPISRFTTMLKRKYPFDLGLGKKTPEETLTPKLA